MQGDHVSFSSVGLWEGFLGVQITRTPYPYTDPSVYFSTQVAETEDGKRIIAIRNPLADQVPEFQAHVDLGEEGAAAFEDFSGKDGCFFMMLEDFLA